MGETFMTGLAGVGAFWLIAIVLGLWSLLWKALALWHSARGGQRGWFMLLLIAPFIFSAILPFGLSIVNSLGVLDIIFLLWFKEDRGGAGASSLLPKQVVSKVEKIMHTVTGKKKE